MVVVHGKVKDKDANGGRDLFIVKKGFVSLPLFGGRVDKCDDWRFKVSTSFKVGRKLSRTAGVDREADQDAGAGRHGCVGV